MRRSASNAELGITVKHPRLHFVQDDNHPLAASHHQKLVVVDGRIAFCGGFDLSKWRWDTSEHIAEDPRRVDADGEPYPPFTTSKCWWTGKPPGRWKPCA